MIKPLALSTSAIAAIALSACGGTTTTTVTETVTASSTTQKATTSQTTTTTQPAPTPVDRTCTVTDVRNVSPTSVAVQLQAKDWPASKNALVNCETATTLVKIIAGEKSEEPVQTDNFDCVPAVTGNKANFVCSGANDTIKYSFTLNYTG